MLYVYAIVDSRRFAPLAGKGHEGADVVLVPCGPCAAAVSTFSAHTIAPTPQNVWHHERVLECLMLGHAVLPLRFGTICRDADVLRDCLPSTPDGYQCNFARVYGRVEMALRLLDRTPAPYAGPTPRSEIDRTPEGRGTSYLRSRADRIRHELDTEDRGKTLEQVLRRVLAAVLDDVICLPHDDGSSRYRISCLVERNRIGAFTGALEDFCGGHPQFDVSWTGPWAPYSFGTTPQLSERLP